VVDARPDTLRLGMYSTNYSIPHQLVTESSIGNLLQEKLGMGTEGEIVLVILKDFWMNELKEKEQKDSDAAKRKTQPVAKLTLNADVFILNNDRYNALARIDTVIFETQSLGSTYNNLMEKALEALHEKMIAAFTENRFRNKTKFTKEFVTSSYIPRYKTKILTDTILKKGVYFSYEDFKNNAPASVNFKVSSVGSSYVLHLIENGTEVFERKAWGVNDGKNTYIVQNGQLYPLYRSNNAFYWMGYKEVTKANYNMPVYVPGGGGTAIMVPTSKGTSDIGRTPLLLNPDTGKEY